MTVDELNGPTDAVKRETMSRNAALLRADRKRENRGLFLLVLPALMIVGILMIAPIAWLFSLSVLEVDGSFTFGHYRRIWTEGAYVSIFVTTFQITLIVTGLCILLGYPIAYTLAILPGRWQQIVLLAVLIPFWTSLLVRTYAWLVLLQRRGIVNSTLMQLGLIDQPLQLVHNMTGTIIGMTHVMLPFLVLPLFAAMQTIDRNLVRAAANLGSSPAHAFMRVFLPLSLPGLIAGSVMVFIMSLGFYITPALLGGGRVQMIAQRIETSVALFPTWGPAAALAVVLLMLTCAFLALSWLIVRRLTPTE